MNRLRTFLEFLKVLHAGEFLGDAVILKVATFGGFEPTENATLLLKNVPRIAPDFSHYDFSSFPPGTLGREYWEFMQRNRLRVFRFSGKHQDLLEKNFLAVWYAGVHDLFHVLTGYEADWEGEAGVWGFVAGQNISPQADRAVSFARILYPVLNPSRRTEIQTALTAGFEAGRKTDSFLTIDFPAEFPKALTEVRRKLGVTFLDRRRKN